MFVDLGALEEQARHGGGEIAYRKLLRGIAGQRSVRGAFCYVEDGTPASVVRALSATGFAVERSLDAAATATSMTLRALEVSDRVDRLVLAPMTTALEPLVATLRDRGMAVEIASFSGEAPAGTSAHKLGRGCLFVP